MSVARKTLTIFLAAAPYSGEHASTAMRLGRAALNAGHRVNIFASADGVYGFAAGGRAKGLPDSLSGALERALADCRADPSCHLQVYVHEGSLRERRLDPTTLVPGVELADDDRVATVIAEARRLLIF